MEYCLEYYCLGSSAVYDASFNIGSQINNAKAAIKYKNSDFAFFVNGAQVDSQTSGTISFNAPLSELSFDSADGLSNFYGKVKGLATYNRALTDTELYTITSTQYSAYSGMVAALGNYTIPC